MSDVNEIKGWTPPPGTGRVTEDDKGRPIPLYMDRDEKIDEILLAIRETQDLVKLFITEFQAKGPLGMMGAFMGGLKK